MRNALMIVIVCLSVSLLYDVYKEPIDRLLHLDQTETNETTETGNRKQKTKKSEKEDCIMLIIKKRTVAFEVEAKDWCDA